MFISHLSHFLDCSTNGSVGYWLIILSVFFTSLLVCLSSFNSLSNSGMGLWSLLTLSGPCFLTSFLLQVPANHTHTHTSHVPENTVKMGSLCALRPMELLCVNLCCSSLACSSASSAWKSPRKTVWSGTRQKGSQPHQSRRRNNLWEAAGTRRWKAVCRRA